MSDFLADRLALLRDELDPSEIVAQPAPQRALLEQARGIVADLSRRELFAFERSALNAAGDLRIDTPDRLDRIVELVTRGPRRLFMEANSDDCLDLAARLRGLVEIPEVPAPGRKWAAFVDLSEEGLMTFRILHTRSRMEIMSDPNLEPLVTQGGRVRPSAAVLRAAALDLHPGAFDLDPRRRTGLSRAEFEMAIQRMSPGMDPLVDLVRTAQAGRGGRDVVSRGWQMARFRDYIRGNGIDLAIIRSGLLITALLALLSIEASDLLRTRRPIRRPAAESRKQPSRVKGTQGVKPKPQSDEQHLAVVTLNLEDRELDRLYQDRAPTSSLPSGSSSETERAPRVRHAVRGHLFLARSGRLVWRRPHWRGSIDVEKIRRVIAPGHR